MNLSFWEQDEWFSNVDFTIIGSGIVGLNTALTLRENHPLAKILVLERGLLPQGASTKNAGFACFGSISEVLSDLESHSEQEVIELVEKRWKGLELLRKNLGDAAIDFQQNGSYELFSKNDTLFDTCADKIDYTNSLLNPVFKNSVFSISDNKFNFKNVKEYYVFNQFEGQIDTGKMMAALLKLAQSKNIKILNNTQVRSFTDLGRSVEIELTDYSFKTNKLLIATNGFASQLLNEEVLPARAQVLITKPIKNLHIKGTFHLEEGYYYFRNINNRILFGGGRNLDFKAEETTVMQTTVLIQNKLEELLSTTILPETSFEIDHRWTGIMGVGKQKKAIVKQLSNNVYCGVRMGGMGVAIGSLIGKELGELL
ncbi:NAD(P)/FAD-dependent oxidoreductase [Pseudofulvibacter geojedonensis]|uniref:NAD(P)/FAD-dependent oxidoreductase n=1 Tax=Pseudofulvibacter geojedonensis TaxID=1123758 RepID=A0ABW3I0T4_9FLAO